MPLRVLSPRRSRQLRAAALSLILTGVLLIIPTSASSAPSIMPLVITPAAAGATATTSKTDVWVSVDSRDGLTRSTLDCGRDGFFTTTNGDATLVMPNLTPHRVVCVITIRSTAG